jgi:hypothetical protein
MDGVDVVAKLYSLRDNLAVLEGNDAAFVTEMVTQHESSHKLILHQVLRIVGMTVPGEPAKEPAHKYGLVNAVFVSPDVVIWRYMPLEQLFALLSKKAVHFSPLSAMKDSTEGTLPRRAWEETKKQLPQDILEGRRSIDAERMMCIMV